MRYCILYESRVIRDKNHDMLICKFFQTSRKKYINKKLTNRQVL